MINKRCLFLLSLIILLVSPILHAFPYILDDFDDGNLWGNAGYFRADGNTFLKGTLSPNLLFDPIEVGLDINIYLPLNENTWYPEDFEIISLRKVAYENDVFGFEFGHLRGVTLGYGLLMSNYDTGMAGTVAYRTSKGGFLGHAYIHERVRIESLYTAGKVLGARASYTHPESPFLNSPIVFGVTYVNDPDGINQNLAGQVVTRSAQQGYCIDVGLPIAGDFLTVYAEAAKLIDHGKGMSAGIKGNLFFMNILYRAEYRKFDADFIPSYFGPSYEATAFDFSTDAPIESSGGFLVSAESTFWNDQIKGGIILENYGNEDPMMTVSVGWKQFWNTIGVVNYIVPFNGGDHAVGTLDMIYRTGQIFDYVLHAKRIYYGDNLFVDSYWIGAQMNLSNIFPNLF
ncbi:hypothetical protein ACFL96_12565 [Thermoproteota archaeon]